MSIQKFFKTCALCRLQNGSGNKTPAYLTQPDKNLVYNAMIQLVRNSSENDQQGYLILGKKLIGETIETKQYEYYLAFTDKNLSTIARTSNLFFGHNFRAFIKKLPPSKYILEYMKTFSEPNTAIFSEDSIVNSSKLTFKNIIKRSTSSSVNLYGYSTFGTSKGEIIVSAIYGNQSDETKLLIMILDKNQNLVKQTAYIMQSGDAIPLPFIEQMQFLEDKKYYYLVANYIGYSVIARIDKETKEITAKGVNSIILDSDIDKDGYLNILIDDYITNYIKLDSNFNVIDNLIIHGGKTYQIKILDNGTVLMTMNSYDPNSDKEVTLLFDATEVRNITKFKVFEETIILLQDTAPKDVFTANYIYIKNYEKYYPFTGIFEYNKLDAILTSTIDTDDPDLLNTLKCYTMNNDTSKDNDGLFITVRDAEMDPRITDLTETSSSDSPFILDNTTFEIPLIKEELPLYSCK